MATWKRKTPAATLVTVVASVLVDFAALRGGEETVGTRGRPAVVHGANRVSGKPTRDGEPLYNLATHEGLEKHRAAFAAKLETHRRQFEREVEAVGYGVHDLAGDDYAFVAWMWAQAEWRALYRGKPLPEDWEESVWKPIFGAAQSVDEHFDERVAEAAQREPGPEADDDARREHERYVRYLDKRSRHYVLLLENAAFLAKLAGRPELVRAVFELKSPIRKFANAKQLLESDQPKWRAPRPPRDERGAVSLETILIIGAIALPILIFLIKVGSRRIREDFMDNIDDLQAD